MASHRAIERHKVGDMVFAVIEFTQGMNYVRKCFINGKPVTKVVYAATLKQARSEVMQ